MGKLFWVVIVALVIGGFMIKSAYDYDLGESDDQKNFIIKFGSWLMKLGGNVKDLTGQAIGMDWTPEINQTNSTEG